MPTSGLHQLSISNHTVPSCVNFIDFFPILLLDLCFGSNNDVLSQSLVYHMDPDADIVDVDGVHVE